MRSFPVLPHVARCLAGVLLAAGLAAQAQVQTPQAIWAFQGQKPAADGHLTVTPVPGKPLTEKLDFWMTLPGKPAPVKSYQTEMTKKLHMIIVSNDFKTFLHLHPTLGPTGHLTLTQTFPAKGTYQVYTDALPGSLNHQVYRFEVDIDGKTPGTRQLPSSGMGTQVGPYEVDLSTTRLRAGQASMIDIVIQKDGKPATDLHPYLGAPAHAVFLDANDLSYVHAHPMGMDQMMDMSKPMPDMPENGPSPNDMMLHLALQKPGTYKLWLQFRGGTQLYVAEFTITAI